MNVGPSVTNSAGTRSRMCRLAMKPQATTSRSHELARVMYTLLFVTNNVCMEFEHRRIQQ